MAGECGPRTLPVKKSILPEVATNQRYQFLLTHSSPGDAAIVAFEAERQSSIYVDQQPVGFPSLQFAIALADGSPESECATTSPAVNQVTSHESSEIGFGREAQPVIGTGSSQHGQVLSDPIMGQVAQILLILFECVGREPVETVFKLLSPNPFREPDFTQDDIRSTEEFSQNQPEGNKLSSASNGVVENFTDLEGTPGYSIIGAECIHPSKIFGFLTDDGARDSDDNEDG